jgi:hypothetical protein
MTRPSYRSALLVPNDVEGQIELHYDSLAAMVSDADGSRPWARGRRQDVQDRSSRQADRDKIEWNGGMTWEQALHAGRYGWPEGTQRIIDLADRIEEQVSQRLPLSGMELMEHGGDVDVASYLSGQRECMWEWTDSGGKQPVVRLTANLAVNFTVSAANIHGTLALVVALADALETVGRRVEIELLLGISGGARTVLIRCDLKHADEPLDRAALAYALGHASVLRRLGFSIMEQLPERWRQALGIPGPYGYPVRAPQDLHGDVHVELEDAAKLGAIRGYDWVLKKLRQQGVEVVGD